MNKELKAAVNKIEQAIAEAEFIAEQCGESFTLEPAYGMGGTFDPRDENEDTGSFWHPSSLSC